MLCREKLAVVMGQSGGIRRAVEERRIPLRFED